MNKDCPQIENCMLYTRTLADQPDVAILMRARYCREDHRLCALRRVAVALGPEAVPEGMFPNQTKKAEELILGRMFEGSPTMELIPEDRFEL